MPDTRTVGHPGELAIRAVVLSAINNEGLPGLGRVQARTEPRLVLPLVQINRQRTGEHDAPRAPVIYDGQRHVLDPIQGLLGQVGQIVAISTSRDPLTNGVRRMPLVSARDRRRPVT